MKPSAIDEVLQNMERAHRSTLEEQLKGFASSITDAKTAFKNFAEYDEDDPAIQNSLLTLVEKEQKVGLDLDSRLKEVKENLAQMERKRMLALAAMTRLSEDDALKSLAKIKEEVLFLALRAPIRADFIVYGQNVSLLLFKLYEQVSKTFDDMKLLIQAKADLDQTTQQNLKQETVQPQQVQPQPQQVQPQPQQVQPQQVQPQQVQPQQVQPQQVQPQQTLRPITVTREVQDDSLVPMIVADMVKPNPPTRAPHPMNRPTHPSRGYQSAILPPALPPNPNQASPLISTAKLQATYASKKPQTSAYQVPEELQPLIPIKKDET